MDVLDAKPVFVEKTANFNRKASRISQDRLVEIDSLFSGEPFPLVIQPAIKGVNLLAWAENNKELVEAYLIKYGAILFRNFDIITSEEFEQIIKALCGETMEYRYRSSPRSLITGNIYTSTDYPADQNIFPHNENAYSHTFPMKIFFFCEVAAQEGGQTPIGSCRNIFRQIDPKIKRRFIEKKVMYIRNISRRFGLPIETVFQTVDKREIEKYCREHGIDYEWKDGDDLRIRQVRPVVIKHPKTGEMVWFNHATFFHISTIEKNIGQLLSTQFTEEDLPTNTYYGDGTPIEQSVLDELRNAYLENMVSFTWQEADLLALDNMLTVHGRTSYKGNRKILTGMAEPYTPQDI
jgi:alpha-ketoglutarate-dependent taurine dioxygenase